MRIAFLDESGRSRHEPFIVVAGILVHADRTYRKLEIRLNGIIDEMIPLDMREGFTFHAKDPFQGAGLFKDKNSWPPPWRWPILEAVARIPAEFEMPVVFGHMDDDDNGPAGGHQVTNRTGGSAWRSE